MNGNFKKMDRILYKKDRILYAKFKKLCYNIKYSMGKCFPTLNLINKKEKIL